MKLNIISQKIFGGEFLSRDEILFLYRNVSLPELMFLANEVRRRKHSENLVGWQIDRNVNITNVCIAGCCFCNFSCKLSESEKSFTTGIEDYAEKINELYKKGGDQLLLQGGLHPKYGLDFYRSLFSELKSRFPTLKLHALGPPEIAHIARLENKSYGYVLEKLVDAGLDSLPGAGAEILSDRVRKLLSPAKPDVKAWLDVMREAHRMNLPTSATMMFGHIETIEERIEHLLLLRDLQAEKPDGNYGFLSFIPWTVQSNGTRLSKKYTVLPVYPSEYLRMIAISRIVLENIENIQASWLTVGKDTAQMSLYAGANDFGSIMIEENVVASAGAKNRFDADGIRQAIIEAGFVPRKRNQKFETVC
ncbi:MAG: radical SAM protein [Prevotellaceae bacterium]|jgi:cyclic dehypoxanthinyl futalosine synthase|nr:radical SAM protein [Prevotellaceae bacterium]